jgi:serine/threonine protein phosphatase PrpC
MADCPSCGSETLAGANFCGRCGAKLRLAAVAVAVAACRCGAGAESIDAAGFCEECGVRQFDAAPGDREELEIDADFAGVTDKGRRHSANEDAIGIVEGPSPTGRVRVLIVCDGVSSASAAARAASAAVAAFARTALEAALAIPFTGGAAPATTLAAALARGPEAVIVWVGDSRAFLLEPTPAQLTRDDSWINEIVASGALTLEQARAHKYAHAIVKSLGGLEEGEAFTPNILETELPAGARLLLCSDGLWNYAEDAEALAACASGDGSALDHCRALVAFANARGGHDNISAVMLRVPGEGVTG